MTGILQFVDLSGTLVFSISGGLAAAEKKLDVFGFVVLALATGIGGGTVRNILLDVYPLVWVAEPIYLLICALAGIVTFFLDPPLRFTSRALILADAAGLAFFAIAGTELARQTGAHWSVAVTMGVVTATGGGLIRDMLRGEVPLILHKDIYASAALAGSVIYVCIVSVGGPSWLAGAAGFVIAFVTRVAAIHFEISLPTRK